MASSSSFPNELDSSILSSISGYLQGLLKRDDVSSDAKDSLGIAAEVIQGLVSDSSSGSSTDDSVSLTDVFTKYASEVSDQARDDFVTFMRQLTEMGFLKGVEPDSDVFRERLEAAHKGYSDKFPTKKLPSLEQLNITYDDLTTAKKKASSSSSDTGKDTSTTDSSSSVSADRKKQAEDLKNEGNAFLKSKQIDKAIMAYTQGIELDPTNAILYSNRAAALSHQKDYVGAAEDARKATEIDPSYIKAYIRLAVAEEQLGNLQEAYDSYGEALKQVKPTSSDWDKYTEKQQALKRRMDEQSGSTMSSSGGSGGGSAGGMPPFGMPGMGGAGGMDFASMLGALGGGAGGDDSGGMGGLAGLMQNPMVQQMAQSMMQNPEMMQQMQSMMSDPSKMSEMSKMMEDPGMMSAMGDLMGGSQGSEIQELGKWFMENPTQAKAAMEEAMHDPEVLEMKADPAVSALFDRLQSGDMSCMSELAAKPELVSKMMAVAKRYIH